MPAWPTSNAPVTFDGPDRSPRWRYGGIVDPKVTRLARGERLFRITTRHTRAPHPGAYLNSPWWLREKDYCLLQALMACEGSPFGDVARRRLAIAPSFNNSADLVVEARVVTPPHPAFSGRGRKFQRPITPTETAETRHFEVAYAHPNLAQLYLPALERGDPLNLRKPARSLLELVRVDKLWSSPSRQP